MTHGCLGSVRHPPLTAATGAAALGPTRAHLSRYRHLLPARALAQDANVGLGVGLGFGVPVLLLLTAYLVWRHRRALPHFTGTHPSPMGQPTRTRPPGLAQAHSHTRSAGTGRADDAYAALGADACLPVSTGPFELKGFSQRELVLEAADEGAAEAGRHALGRGTQGARDGAGTGAEVHKRTTSYSERVDPGCLLRPLGSREVFKLRGAGGEGGAGAGAAEGRRSGKGEGASLSPDKCRR